MTEPKSQAQAEQNQQEPKKQEAQEKQPQEKQQKSLNPFAKQPGSANKAPKFNFIWLYGIIIVLLIGLQYYPMGGGPKEIDWRRFEKEMLRPHDVERLVVVNREKAEVYIKKDSLKKATYKDITSDKAFKGAGEGPQYIFNIGSDVFFSSNLDKAQLNASDEDKVNPEFETRKDYFGDILGFLVPIAIFVVIWLVVFRRLSNKAGGAAGNIFSVGKSKARLFDKEANIKINFNDVAGLEEAKIEIMEIVDFLKSPKKYTELGGKIPKGALLVGPPGTGKTLLAKAVAGEANVPFFSLSGSDFVEMFVGVGASRVRDLFEQAKAKAPCIVFIDEIDAIGRARGKNAGFSSNDERENTLNQLLSEMDGFGDNSGVIIMAATNRVDILDRALLRAGRFDRQIHVELPDLNERKDIFKVHLRPLKLDPALDLDFLSRQTPGFSGADIANVCNEAALIAARKGKVQVERQDFLDAIDRIVAGLERKNKIISTGEKRTIAFHEAGHATVSWFLEHANPLVKVTIIPRGRSLGAAWYLPEERQITTAEQLLDEMCSGLGGRAAEEYIFKQVSTGAVNDLERVTKQAYAMVAFFGMSEKIGNLSYYDSSGMNEYSFNKPYSEKTAETIDEEVRRIIDESYKKAKKLLVQHKDGFEKLANTLLEKEVIFKEDLEEIFGKRPSELNNEELGEYKTKKKKTVKKDTETPEIVGSLFGGDVKSVEEKPAHVKPDELVNKTNNEA